MKVLIFSDSHEDVETMLKVAKHETPDIICHCGDNLIDALELQKHINIPLHCVAGNTDTAEANLYEKYVEICNKRFLLIHGHQFKDTAEMFSYGVVEGGAEIILYGHTHIPSITGHIEQEGYSRDIRKWLFNPGSIKASLLAPPTYGLIHLTKYINDVRCEIVQVPEHLR